ncbi:MAG: DUF302 domain-containing protein [Coriobacteriia bacterium]|nr:DUF302 domain-containing protein [Coriobacteriia bacterium]
MSLTGAEQVDRREDGALGYDYRRVCACGFDEAVASVEAALGRHGFAVSAMHDIQATLAAKGFAIQPIRIYEVRGQSPASGSAGTLEDETGSRLARLMPCRINIFVEDESVVVTALRPTLLCKVFPEEDLGEIAAAIERVLVAVVDEAAG